MRSDDVTHAPMSGQCGPRKPRVRLCLVESSRQSLFADLCWTCAVVLEYFRILLLYVVLSCFVNLNMMKCNLNFIYLSNWIRNYEFIECLFFTWFSYLSWSPAPCEFALGKMLLDFCIFCLPWHVIIRWVNDYSMKKVLITCFTFTLSVWVLRF